MTVTDRKTYLPLAVALGIGLVALVLTRLFLVESMEFAMALALAIGGAAGYIFHKLSTKGHSGEGER